MPSSDIPIRLLVIEDDRAVGDLLRRVFEIDGHAVEIAADTSDALTRASTFRPHVVITDWRLVGAPWEAHDLLALRERAGLVICSGYAPAENEAVALGVPFVRKPFDLDELEDAVARALAEAGGSRTRSASI
jgi:DNA-binding NtrC family response regulator